MKEYGSKNISNNYINPQDLADLTLYAE